MHESDNWFATATWTGALALLLTIVTGGIWTVLLLANLATTPSVPWAAAAMALVLWSLWSYLGGRWRPERTCEARRHYLRANRVPGRIFAWALLAGGLSVVSLTGLWIVMFRLVRIPGNAVTDLSRFSLIMIVAVLVMASLVSSIVEEAGFRGYVQVALESHFRGPGAVLISALLIAPAHALTQGFVWPTILFYFLVDTMLGTSAYLTKSILPGIVVHATGLLIFFGLIWPQDRHRELIWGSGADTWFWIHVAQAVVFASLGIMAFVHLARLAEPKAPAAA
jgi:membrane protease YdiL (CAAX protease family)